MLPSILLLLYFLAGIYPAYRERTKSPGHTAKFYDILKFWAIILVLLYFGDFFNPLIEKI